MSTIQMINLGVGVGLSLLVGLVTHSKASGKLKANLLLGLSVVGAAVTTAAQSALTLKGFESAFVSQLSAGALAHLAVLGPNGITGDGGLLSKIGLQLGAPAPAPVDTSQMPVSTPEAAPASGNVQVVTPAEPPAVPPATS